MKQELPRDGDKKELDARNSMEGLGDVLLCEVCLTAISSQSNFWSVQIVSCVKSSHISAREPMYFIPLCYAITVNCISP
jgi:hypothetical protein